MFAFICANLAVNVKLVVRLQTLQCRVASSASKTRLRFRALSFNSEVEHKREVKHTDVGNVSRRHHLLCFDDSTASSLSSYHTVPPRGLRY